MHHEARSQKRSSRTWILGCFAAALVGLVSALVELPFHQTSAIELAIVSGICLVLALTGWWSTLSPSASRSYAASRSPHLAEATLQSIGATAE